MIKGTNVVLTYPARKTTDEHHVLKGATFTIEKGRITSFIGASGAGKTSLLKCIANLITHYDGLIDFQGEHVRDFDNKKRITNIGFVFQQFNLFPHMTVLKNCMHPLIHVLGLTDTLAEKRARQTLDRVGMSQFTSSCPAQLSGGQQQRVAIARALCLQPKVLLFDEPTSALDPQSTSSLQNVVRDLAASGVTIAFSSHDMPFIKALIDKVYFLENGVIAQAYDEHDASSRMEGKIADFLHG